MKTTTTLMKCVPVLVGLIALALPGCEREQPSGEAAPKAASADKAAEAPKPAAPQNAAAAAARDADKPKGWSAAGMQAAQQLADKLRAAGMTCNEFEESNFGLYDEDYQKRLPLAAAIASCTTDDDEDLTFEVFEDAQHARQFVDVKQQF